MSRAGRVSRVSRVSRERPFGPGGVGANGRSRRGGRAAALVLAGALWLAGCGGDGERATTTARSGPASAREQSAARTAKPSAVERLEVGRGARSAVIFRPRGVDRPPGVVFLHGWGATEPSVYGAWIRHLVARGNQVIFPRYQDGPLSYPGVALPNAILGLRAALRRAPIADGSLVAAGHSAGGALAADLAANADRSGVPRPRAVFAAYPGRELGALPFGIPEIAPRRIASSTRILALAGTRDDIVGTRFARRIARGATRVPARRRTLRIVDDPRASDHLAPQRADPAARRVFWAALDRLIRQTRRPE